jgi:peptidyl-prolyl cis-trans isomerase A (cyclophilin A)
MWRAMAVAVVLSMPQGGAPAAAVRSPVIVTLDTDKGRIEIAVDVAHAPVSAANFLLYVDAGAYNGGAFHRTVRPDTETRKDVPIDVIQARRSAGSQGWPAIALERTSVTGLKHLDGTVSMARSGPDSATSDFFICIGDQPLLDFGGARNADGQGFAAFGRVVAGMDVVRAIQKSPAAPNSQNLSPPVAITKAARK